MKQKIYLLLLMLFTAGFMNAQRWQIDSGTGEFAEEKWAVVEEPIHRWHVTIGNQIDANQKSCIWIVCYDVNGAPVSSFKSELDRDIIVRDISLAPYDGEEPTFYVTGWSKGISGNAFFLGRMYRFGNFMWYTESDVNNDKEGEGVAVVTAKNGDAVAVGHRQVAGKQIHIMRYNPAGGMVWSRVHYLPNTNWLVREIDLGVQSDICGAGNLEGNFVVVGEGWLNEDVNSRPTSFVAQYNGDGDECWRNLYLATDPSSSKGDAAYDVVYDPITKNYQVVGSVDYSNIRGINSSPYIFAVDNNGNQVATGIYRQGNDQPMGCYPRCVSLGLEQNIVMAGPYFDPNSTSTGLGTAFFASLPVMGSMGPLYLGFYTGPFNKPTANYLPQPYWFQESQPEDIVINLFGNAPGYIISSNAFPDGDLGKGDGVLLSTDAVGEVNSGECYIKVIESALKEYPSQQPVDRISEYWHETPYYDPIRSEYPIDQKICNALDCVVNCGFNVSVSGFVGTFTNTSAGTGTLSYAWDFGDPASGIFNTSTLQDPTHTFTGAGSFTVCLTVTNTMPDGTTCSVTCCQIVTITCVITPSFTVSMNCYTGTFTSTSTGTGVLTYQWSIDAGAFVPGGPTYTYTFATCGTHTVTLRVCNGLCPCQDITQTINIPCCNANSDFCLVVNGLSVTVQLTAAAGTTYQIYDNSVLQAGWLINTPITMTAGNHTICVRATQTVCGVSCCSTCCKNISLSAPCSLVTTFTANSNTTNTSVVFTGSAGATTNSWNFGDPASGASNTATTATATHIFTAPGTYTVCLTQTKTTTVATIVTTCTETVCKTVVVDAPCNLSVHYTSTTCIATPNTVVFSSAPTTGTAVGATYSWNFGDPTSGVNNTSNLPNPTHVFTGGFATYTVCLTVSNGPLCTSTVCYRVRVSNRSCNTSCTTLPTTPAGMQMDDSGDTDIVDPTVIDDTVDGNGKGNGTGNGERTESTSGNDLNLFPNPTSDILNLQLKSASDTYGNIMIMSSTGEVVNQFSTQVIQGNQQIQIPTNSLSDGLYHVTISLKDEVITKHFTVAKK